MQTDAFSFALPPHLIAQQPLPARDKSRLFVLDRSAKSFTHRPFFNCLLDYLHPGDLLVLNDSRVLHARLYGEKSGSKGQIEILLVEQVEKNSWWAMLRPGRRVHPGTRLVFRAPQTGQTLDAVVLEKNVEGHCRLAFSGVEDIADVLDEFGEVPLPPYVTRPAQAEDRERYQTVYAVAPGSVAAPTAGLHFTRELLADAQRMGVEIAHVTLHVGLGTFAPVKAKMVQQHTMHEERFSISEATVEAIAATKTRGCRVFGVGTTSVRVLETVAAQNRGEVVPGQGRTRIFIYPPFRFQVVDALVTNFHLPRSTLLMLVSAFAAPGETSGRELVLRAYEEAVREGYRFFSYGDAMLLL